MDRQQVTVLGVVLLAVWGAAAPVAGAAAAVLDAGTAQQETTQGATGADENGTAMGARVSSFMQSSAASAEGDVDAGMWNARFENAPADRRPELVRQRVDTLRERLQELRDRREALLDGGNATMAERARAARLAASARSLSEAINGTERAAEQAGVNATALDELRRGARNLTGQEVAELAPGTGPGIQPAGPPSNVGADSQGNESVPPGTEGAPGTQGNETGTEAAPNGTRKQTAGSGGQPSDGSDSTSESGDAGEAGTSGGGSSGNSGTPPDGSGGGTTGNDGGDTSGSGSSAGEESGDGGAA